MAERHYTLDAGRTAVCGAGDYPLLTSFEDQVTCEACQTWLRPGRTLEDERPGITTTGDGKQVDCVQSILHRGGELAGLTIRFTDGLLLKLNGAALDLKLIHESDLFAALESRRA